MISRTVLKAYPKDPHTSPPWFEACVPISRRLGSPLLYMHQCYHVLQDLRPLASPRHRKDISSVVQLQVIPFCVQ